MGDLTKVRQSVSSAEDMAALRDLATKAVAKAAAADLNVEYGYPDGTTVSARGYRGYKPEDIDPDSIPLSIDLIQFVLWLRHNSDFFSGPNLDIHYPEYNSPEFTDVLGELAIIYTGE